MIRIMMTIMVKMVLIEIMNMTLITMMIMIMTVIIITEYQWCCQIEGHVGITTLISVQ